MSHPPYIYRWFRVVVSTSGICGSILIAYTGMWAPAFVLAVATGYIHRTFIQLTELHRRSSNGF